MNLGIILLYYRSFITKKSVICFVDLAGSEKVSQTNATGQVLTVLLIYYIGKYTY